MAEEKETIVVTEEPVLDLKTSIAKVLNYARCAHKLSRGLREVTKAIESERAQVVFIAQGCDDPAYKDLIEALCKDKSIPYLFIDDTPLSLGEWCGLVRYKRKDIVKGKDDEEVKLEKAKSIKCSSCAVMKGGMQAGAPETQLVLKELGAA